jgi:hypothetical protein
MSPETIAPIFELRDVQLPALRGINGELDRGINLAVKPGRTL